jgi:hypothetical protein
MAACLLGPLASFAQHYKTYSIGVKGDTLNAIDAKDQRQGKWIVKAPALRGEPGYEEEGEYKDGKKEGIWRRYSLMGDVLAVESYRWGNKDGISQYFTVKGPEREESWKAVNPDNPFDTIEVPDPIDPYKVTMQVIKVEGSTVKHGVWRFYDPENGRLMKTEKYFLGKLEDPNKKPATAAAVTDSTGLEVRKKLSDENKPKEVLEFDKKNSKKKQYKVRDGRAGY